MSSSRDAAATAHDMSVAKAVEDAASARARSDKADEQTHASGGSSQDRLELSATSKVSISKANAAVRDAEAGKRGKDMAVPTDPRRVQLVLREIGEPICFFGERPADRRRRLTLRLGELLLSVEEGAAITASQHSALTAAIESGEESLRAAVRAARRDGGAATDGPGTGSDPSTQQGPATVYSHASGPLVEARLRIGDESLRRAHARLVRAREASSTADARRQRDVEDARSVARARAMPVQQSQVADARPLASVAVDLLLRHGEADMAVSQAAGAGSGSSFQRSHSQAAGSADGDSSSSSSSSSSSNSSSSSSSSSSSNSAVGGGTGVVVTASFSGSVRLFSMGALQHLRTLRGHTERVTGTAMRGAATGQPSELMSLPADVEAASAGQPSSSSSAASTAEPSLPVTGAGDLFLATGGCDSLVMLWGCRSDTPAAVLRGHAHRVSRVAWHPHGRHIGSTSYDTTWRLWDAETQAELLLQDGHATETFPIAFHPDGSLVATGDLGGIGRVWDLRTGKAVTTLRGHARQLLSLDFSPDGITLASGSEDHSAIAWDLRARRPLATMPAHKSLVSGVRFCPAGGAVLSTCSFDGTIKTWETRTFTLLSVLEGHSGRVMGIDAAADGRSIVSCGWDRTVKVWRDPSESA